MSDSTTVVAKDVGRARNLIRRFVEPKSARTAAAIGWASRGIMAITQFATIRILTDLLGISGYAAYAVILGLQYWFNLADFGFGASLQNRLSVLRVRGKRGERTFAAVALFLGGMGVLLGIVVVAVSPFAGPALLRKFPNITTSEATSAFAVYGVFMVVSVVSSLALRRFYSEHRAHLGYLVTVVGNVLGFALLSLLPLIHLERPLIAAIVFYLGPGSIIPAALLWRQLLPVLRSRAARVNVRKMWRYKMGFLWRQARHIMFVTFVAGWVVSSDYLILSQFASHEQIAAYAIINRIFAFALTLFTNMTMAFWPILTEAIAQKDSTRLKKVILECLLVGFALVGTCSVVLAVGRELLVELLSPHNLIVVPIVLVGASSLYWCMRIWSDTCFTVLQAGGRADLVSAIAALQAVTALALQIIGAKYWGATGLILGLTASFALTASWYLPYQIAKQFITQRT